jgi:hypothetical protein
MKSQSILILAVVVLLAGLSGGVYAGTYSGGTGEPNDPYRIATPNDLNDIGNHIEDFNKCFVMVNDINLVDYNGTQFNMIGEWIAHLDPNNKPFTGVFDGNGHTICNFTYETVGSETYGLCRFVDDPRAEIKNLKLVHAEVNAVNAWVVGALVGRFGEGTVTNCCTKGGYITGDGCTGGLVGYIYDGSIVNCYAHGSVNGHENTGGLVGQNDGVIRNCYAMGKVSGENGTGGLVGWNWDGIIQNSHASATVAGNHGSGGLVGVNFSTIRECYARGTVDGNNDTGGLAGDNDEDGWISNCYSKASVTGDRCTGGLVGQNGKIFASSIVSKCYAVGSVSGNECVGGLVGNNNSASIAASFWDANSTGQATSDGGGTGLPTSQMQTETTFTDAGWDFVEVWDIGENQTYPFLRVYPAGDLNHDGLVSFADVAILALHWLEGTEP